MTVEHPLERPFSQWNNFVLLLTHRRGGVVLAVDLQKLQKLSTNSPVSSFAHELALFFGENSNEKWKEFLIDWILSLREKVHQGTQAVEMLCSHGVVLALSRATTAEFLADMYMRSVASMGWTDAQVENVVLGAGPGSFTGLRIGCAFANGLMQGKARALWAMPCVPLASIRESALRHEMYELWHPDFAIIEAGKDESFAPMGLLDAAVAIAKIGCECCEFTTELEPNYGKEPGPVIKLRAQEAQQEESGNG